MPSLRRTLPLALAATGAVLNATSSTPASAASASLATLPVHSGRIHLTLPGARTAATASSNNLQYNGGQVETGPTTSYAIFWEPTGSTVASGYNSLIDRFLTDVGGSSIYGVAGQYYQTIGGTTTHITNGSSLGASWVDTRPYPAPALLDSDIQNEVLHAMSVNGWTGGVGHEFFVFTARNEISCESAFCSNTYFCAYHGNFNSGGQDILYADQPYTNTLPTGCDTPSSPNNNIDADSTINVVSHEMLETVTDPNIDAWFDASGNEIGDKCNFTFGPTDATGADITINGHPYIVQEEWSNSRAGCSMS